MFVPPRRPNRADTEEDLLRQQQEFLRAKRQQVQQEQEPHEGLPSAPSKAAESTPTTSSSSPTLARQVMTSKLVERRTVVCLPPKPPQEQSRGPTTAASGAFPQVFKITEDDHGEAAAAAASGSAADKDESGREAVDKKNKEKKQSIFARMAAAKKAAAASSSRSAEGLLTQQLQHDAGVAVAPAEVDYGVGSRVIDGSGLAERPGEAEAIHRENADRLRSMTHEEIRAERDEIMQRLDPKLVEFLRSRKERPPRGGDVSVTSMKKNKLAMDMGAIDVKRTKLNKAGAFLNMDRPEPEKMEWTKDVSKEEEVAAPSKDIGGYSARFGLDGQLLDPASSEALPSNSGLYHHGEEPSRPGYTPEELLTLARSSNPQQKSLALETLAAAVRTFKSGQLDACLEQNLVGELLASDLVLVLRTTLDEQSSNLRESSLLCLRQLVDSQFDEAALDAGYCLSHLGHMQPSLPTAIVSDPEKRAEFRKDEAGLKDAEVVKLDVIKGLLRTNLLDRFAYLLDRQLEDLTPSALANMACILVRISRHSLQAASEVAAHRSLAAALVRAADKHRDEAKVTASFLKLARMLSAWSRNMAVEVERAWGLRHRISSLVAAGFGSLGPSLEALRTWDALLRYGLAADLFLDLYPLVAKFFVGLRAQLEPAVASGEEDSAIHLELACCVLKVTEAAATLVGSPESAIEVRHLKDLQRLTRDCLALMMKSAYDDGEESKRKVKLLSVATDTYSAMLEAAAREPDEVLATVREAEDAYLKLAVPFLQTEMVAKCCSALTTRSAYLLAGSDGDEGRSSRDPPNLPSVGAVCFGGRVVPSATVAEPSPFRLLCAAMKLISSCRSVNKALDLGPVRSWMLTRCSDYLKAICSKREMLSLRSNWFVADELALVAFAAVFAATGGEEVSALPKTALTLLQTRHAFLAKPIFDKVFDCASGGQLEAGIARLDIDGDAGRPAAEDLRQIRDLYSTVLPGSSRANDKKSRVLPKTLTERNCGELLLPHDWSFLPLLHVYNRDQARAESADREDKTLTKEDSDREKSRVETCLRWVALDLSSRARMSRSESAVYLARLSTAFLVDFESLFLDERVGKCLETCLGELVRVCRGDFDLGNPVPGVGAFKPFYVQLLEEYSASSYGNVVFGAAALIPTLASASTGDALVTTLWADRADDLRYFVLAPSDLPAPLTPASFVRATPSADLVESMARALVGGAVNEKRNPLLFEIARKNIVNAATRGGGGDDAVAKVVEKHRDVLAKFGLALDQV